jgi:hypothetical protein
VSFHAADACSGFRAADLYRGDTPGSPLDSLHMIGGNVTPTFRDTVPENGLYFYRYVLVDQVGNWGHSGLIEARVDSCSGDPVPPGFTTGLQLQAAGGCLQVTFSPAPGADTHRLFRAPLETLPAGYEFRAEMGPDGTPGTQDDVGICKIEGPTGCEPGALVTPGSFYFLAAGVNEHGVGPAGWDSSFVTRLTQAPDSCP